MYVQLVDERLAAIAALPPADTEVFASEKDIVVALKAALSL